MDPLALTLLLVLVFGGGLLVGMLTLILVGLVVKRKQDEKLRAAAGRVVLRSEKRSFE